VSDRWVVDASPLIALARVGHADWLQQLADEVVVPEPVVKEVLAGPPDPARELLAGGRLTVVEPPATPPDVAAWSLGAGETAVLGWAGCNLVWTAILDDLPARRCARSLDVPHKGTLALVIMARQRGLIDSAADVIRHLRQAGLRLDDAVIGPALRATVDEDWP